MILPVGGQLRGVSLADFGTHGVQMIRPYRVSSDTVRLDFVSQPPTISTSSTSRLAVLSSILLRRSSIPVQGHAFRTGLCSVDISVRWYYLETGQYHWTYWMYTSRLPALSQSIVKAFVAPLHTLGLKLHFYLDDWILRYDSNDILKSQMKLLIKNVSWPDG
jgi:hypothetical protein